LNKKKFILLKNNKMNFDTLLNFWFDKGKSFNKKWFDKSIDTYIIDNFMDLYNTVCNSDVNDLKKTEELCFGSIIVLDQLTRNIHRGTDKIYENDMKALELSNYYMRNYIKSDIELQYLIFILFPYRHYRKVESLNYVLSVLDEYKKLHFDYDKILMDKFYNKTLEEIKKIE
jgi:uncharacterized protein (DUF924 family)